MPAFPEMPAQLRNDLPEPFWHWWQAFRTYMLATLFTNQDITVMAAGSGVILTTPDGTKQYRITVDNSGTVTSTLVV